MSPIELLDRRDLVALRSLDAAPGPLTDAERIRGDAALERILAGAATLQADPAWALDMPSAAVPWWRRRAVLLPGAAATLAAALVVAPGIGGGGAAYASWTPTPTVASTEDVAEVTRACRDTLAEVSPEMRAPVDAEAATPVVAERRGEWVGVLLRSGGPGRGASAACIARDPVGSHAPPQEVHLAVGGGGGAAPTAGHGQLLEGFVAQLGEPPVSFAEGTVGPDVAGVTIHAGERSVVATVESGRYVAWWPGRAFEAGPLPPSGEGGPATLMRYDLVLTDGTVVPGSAPARPGLGSTSGSAGSGSPTT